MVGLGGLEPPTSPLSGARSSHLSYRPDAKTTILKFYQAAAPHTTIQSKRYATQNELSAQPADKPNPKDPKIT